MKAIAETLLDFMQTADRFHLYQNLSSAIKKMLQSEVPERIKGSMEADDESKSAESEAIKTPPEEGGGKMRLSSFGIPLLDAIFIE